MLDQKVILITTTLTASGVYTTQSELDLTPDQLKQFFEEHMQIRESEVEGMKLAIGGKIDGNNISGD